MIITPQNVNQSFRLTCDAVQPLTQARTLLSRAQLAQGQQLTNAEIRTILATTVDALHSLALAFSGFLLELQPDHSRHRR